MAYARRVDGNHRDIRDALERIGWTVVDFSSVGRGIPDLYAAKAGRELWIEVKDGSKPPSERKLTPEQEKFHAKMQRAGVEIVTVTSVDEAVRL